MGPGGWGPDVTREEAAELRRALHRGRRGRGRGEEVPDAGDVGGWLGGRLPDEWFEAAPQITVDRDEILVVGRISAPDVGGDEAARAAAETGRITRFREETRERRMEIAREAEHRYSRTVSWGAQCGETTEMFTTLSAPVMTRLRQPERQVLDTLVEAGVARSRSDALGWCVRLVAEHADDWLARLRAAMTDVERVRAEGPDRG
jgi:hypothetical protein